MEIKAKDIVLKFLNALNSENFDAAKQVLDDNMKFNGVMGSRDGAESYIKDMSKMRFKYDVLKVFENENDVCVFYDIDMNGKKIFTCGWYVLQDGKIKSLRVIFDPRPLLEK
jgi:hypothetical protein